MYNVPSFNSSSRKFHIDVEKEKKIVLHALFASMLLFIAFIVLMLNLYIRWIINVDSFTHSFCSIKIQSSNTQRRRQEQYKKKQRTHDWSIDSIAAGKNELKTQNYIHNDII